MDREKKIIKTSILGIIVNIILVLFKMIIGLIVNSIAIILDALNNLTDAISSVVTIIGTKLSNKLPDKKHPYGYGRIEYFTSVIIASLVLVAGITALKESVLKVINPTEVDYSIISLIIIGIAVIVKFVFGRYVKSVGKNVNSGSLIASGEDAFMDSILSFSTLIAALINIIWHFSLEGYLGVVIALFIIKSAIEMLKETINTMIGERADKELTDEIKKKICKYKEVHGAYDLSLHTYGPSKTIGTVHIQVDDDMTALQLHTLTRKIIVDIYNEFGIIFTIGIYASNDKGEFKDLKKYIVSIIKKYKYIKQLHGFYVDKENNDVYFDLIFDFECKNREEIRKEIINMLSSKYKKYNFNIIIDDDISD